MAAAGMSHSQLAAMLAVNGCLAHIAGGVRGAVPVEAVPVTELERNDIGLKQGGQTFFYPLPPEAGVFLDLNGAEASVWYNFGDIERGLAAVEQAMKQAYPRAKQLKDETHPTERGMRRRSYEVDLGNRRAALVALEYPDRGGPKHFAAHIVAQQRRG